MLRSVAGIGWLKRAGIVNRIIAWNAGIPPNFNRSPLGRAVGWGVGHCRIVRYNKGRIVVVGVGTSGVVVGVRCTSNVAGGIGGGDCVGGGGGGCGGVGGLLGRVFVRNEAPDATVPSEV